MRPPPDSFTLPAAAVPTAGCVRTVPLDVDEAGRQAPLGRAALGRAALGRAGERLACAHLVEVHGLVPVATNLRVAVEDLRGELDVVLRDPRTGTLVVCEVKTRSTSASGGALEALSARQQARIRRMTAVLLATGQLHGRGVRFDLVTIDVTAPRSGAVVRLGHVTNAW